MAEEISYEGKLYELWVYRSLRWNLLITTVAWMVITTGYYAINLLLKYLAGNIFLNSYTTAAGEIVGKAAGGFVIVCIGLKRMYLVSFSLAILGCIGMIVFAEYGSLTPYCVFISKLGYCMSFLGVYYNIILLFPTILKSSSMGFCNFFGRVAGIFAPVIAELVPPVNLLILLAGTAVTLILSQCLIVPIVKKC